MFVPCTCLIPCSSRMHPNSLLALFHVCFALFCFAFCSHLSFFVYLSAGLAAMVSLYGTNHPCLICCFVCFLPRLLISLCVRAVFSSFSIVVFVREVPHVNLLSKCDLLPKNANLDRFAVHSSVLLLCLLCHPLLYFSRSLALFARSLSRSLACVSLSIRFLEADALSITSLLNAEMPASRWTKLNMTLGQLVSRFCSVVTVRLIDCDRIQTIVRQLWQLFTWLLVASLLLSASLSCCLPLPLSQVDDYSMVSFVPLNPKVRFFPTQAERRKGN